MLTPTKKRIKESAGRMIQLLSKERSWFPFICSADNSDVKFVDHLILFTASLGLTFSLFMLFQRSLSAPRLY